VDAEEDPCEDRDRRRREEEAERRWRILVRWLPPVVIGGMVLWMIAIWAALSQ
jgi:hypothetical protein